MSLDAQWDVGVCGGGWGDFVPIIVITMSSVCSHKNISQTELRGRGEVCGGDLTGTNSAVEARDSSWSILWKMQGTPNRHTQPVIRAKLIAGPEQWSEVTDRSAADNCNRTCRPPPE